VLTCPKCGNSQWEKDGALFAEGKDEPIEQTYMCGNDQCAARVTIDTEGNILHTQT
jgi:uncharacterized protein YlaI